MHLTKRDREIIRLIRRHRFLRSHQIITLLGGSAQQISRRLKLLFHHGYLERPRAQLEYFHQGGSSHIVYGLSDKAGRLLNQEDVSLSDSGLWSEKNRGAGRMFLEHALLVSDIMVSLELGCRKQEGVTLLYEDELSLHPKQRPFQWRVKLQDGSKLGVIPDRVFGLEYFDNNAKAKRVYFFLEADRGTMPVTRRSLSQTSFARKLIAYEATWTQKIHERYFGIHRFRVLTVTTSAARMNSLLAACARLKRGHGLFLFADRTVLEKNLFSPVWHCGKSGRTEVLLDLPQTANHPVS